MAENYHQLEKRLRDQADHIAQLERDNEVLTKALHAKASLTALPISECATMQTKIAELMRLYQQEIADKPRMIKDERYRRLRANLVFEEALEFVEAMGFEVDTSLSHIELELRLSETAPNLIEAADAIGDIMVVTLGAANALGIDAQSVFNEVHRSNLTKVHPDGSLHTRESDGKVIKPDTYSPPDIRKVLKTQGWDEQEESVDTA